MNYRNMVAGGLIIAGLGLSVDGTRRMTGRIYPPSETIQEFYDLEKQLNTSVRAMDVDEQLVKEYEPLRARYQAMEQDREFQKLLEEHKLMTDNYRVRGFLEAMLGAFPIGVGISLLLSATERDRRIRNL